MDVRLESFHITCCECAVPVGSSGPARATLLLPCQHVLHLRCAEYLRRQQELRLEAVSHGFSLRSIFYSCKEYQNTKFCCPGCSVKVEKVVPLYIGEEAHASIEEHHCINHTELEKKAKQGKQEEKIYEEENVIKEMEKVFHSQKNNLASLRGLIKEKLLFHDLTRSCASLHNEQTKLQTELEKCACVMPQLNGIPSSLCSSASSSNELPSSSSFPLLAKCSAEELQMYLAHTSPVLYETEKELRRIRKKNDHKRKQVQKLVLRYRQLWKKRSVLPCGKERPHHYAHVVETREISTTVRRQEAAQSICPSGIVSRPLCGSPSGCSTTDEHSSVLREWTSSGSQHHNARSARSPAEDSYNSSSSTKKEWDHQSSDENVLTDTSRKECENQVDNRFPSVGMGGRIRSRREGKVEVEGMNDTRETIWELRTKHKRVCIDGSYLSDVDDGSYSETTLMKTSPNANGFAGLLEVSQKQEETDENENVEGRQIHLRSFRGCETPDSFMSSFPRTDRTRSTASRATICVNVDEEDDEDGQNHSSNDDAYVISDSEHRNGEEEEELVDDYRNLQLDLLHNRAWNGSTAVNYFRAASTAEAGNFCSALSETEISLHELENSTAFDDACRENREAEGEEVGMDTFFTGSLSAPTRPLRPGNWATDRVPKNALQLLPRREDYLWQRQLS